MKKDAKKTLIKLVVAVPLMFAFGFALVPLYDVFCEVTGINGKVFQSEHSEDLTSCGQPSRRQYCTQHHAMEGGGRCRT